MRVKQEKEKLRVEFRKLEKLYAKEIFLGKMRKRL